MLHKNCPLYDECIATRSMIIDGVINDCGVSDYRDCEIYQACKDAKNAITCIADIIESFIDEVIE